MLDPAGPGDPLLIAFGGIAGRLAMPPFEFFRLTSAVPCGKVFVRDLHQAWYHRGVADLGASIDETASALGDLIASQVPGRVVTIGNSAGGYAALLFGHLVSRIDAVMAFSPQTFIDRTHRLVHRDRRWRREIAALHALDARSRGYLDLRAALRRPEVGSPETHVFASADDRLDRIHARRLAGIRGVTVHEYPSGGHSLIRSLRDRGELAPLLLAALRDEPLLPVLASTEDHRSSPRGSSPSSSPQDEG
jgi:acetyl esterase/lipase